MQNNNYGYFFVYCLKVLFADAEFTASLLVKALENRATNGQHTNKVRENKDKMFPKLKDSKLLLHNSIKH